MTTKFEFEQALREELLYRSRKFSKLCYHLMIVNGTVATFSCGLLMMGKIHDSVIPVIAGFGTTLLVNRAGEESRQSLELLIDYLEQSEKRRGFIV
jgi:hypothetical protein